MRGSIVNLCAVASLLCACGGDNPNNVPQYGQWEMVRTIDSVTLDGIAFAADELPDEFRQMEKSESICGEPTYTDRAWQVDDVRHRTHGICELERYSHSSHGATLEGSCTIEARGVEYRPTMSGSSTFDETSTRDVLIMEGTLFVEEEPGPHVLKVIAVQQGNRTGDC